MEYKDYYQILGVERSADEKDIRRAFRKLARTYHPDVNPGDEEAEERFKEINEAYEVLSDAEKRQKYDQLGSAYHDWQRGGRQPGDFDWSQWAAGGAPGGQRVHVNYGTPEDLQDLFGGGSPFSDFFSQIFGGVAGGGGGRARTARGAPGGFDYRARSQRGQDYEQEVEITLREAYQGTTRTLQKDGRRLQVKIPAGARTGTRIRLAGEGGAGGGSGQRGDLFLRVRVQPDARFERRGDDLYTDVSVNLYTAVLGGEIQVPTLEGAVMLNIPAGTQNGQAFRLRGKGMPHVKGPDSYGDLYAKVDVQLPTGLTPRQRELFEELQAISR